MSLEGKKGGGGNKGKQHHSFIAFRWDSGGHRERWPASGQVLSDLMIAVVHVSVSGEKDNSLQDQAGACGHSVVLLSGEMLFCAHFACQLSCLVHLRGTLKQIMSNTDHCDGATAIQCQRSFPFIFMRAALASVSAMQSCHITLALQSLRFVSVGGGGGGEPPPHPNRGGGGGRRHHYTQTKKKPQKPKPILI